MSPQRTAAQVSNWTKQSAGHLDPSQPNCCPFWYSALAIKLNLSPFHHTVHVLICRDNKIRGDFSICRVVSCFKLNCSLSKPQCPAWVACDSTGEVWGPRQQWVLELWCVTAPLWRTVNHEGRDEFTTVVIGQFLISFVPHFTLFFNHPPVTYIRTRLNPTVLCSALQK